jgi:hypothetical protein
LTRPLLSNAGRRLRRPTRAKIVAFVVLSVLLAALMAAPAGSAQELDPLAAVEQSMDGGGMPAPMDVEAEIEEAVEAGGVPAVLESPEEPAPSPAPSPQPQSDVPTPPNGGVPSETAPEPAPESQPTDTGVEDAEPAAPMAPINLNVDIRILSPGDNGDVTQEMTLPGWSGPVGGGSQGQPLAWTWNWTWNWTTPAGDVMPRVDDDPLDEIFGTPSPREVFGSPVPSDPGEFFTEAPVEEPAAMPPQLPGPTSAADHPPPPRRDAAALWGGGTSGWFSAGSEAWSLPTVTGSADGVTSVVTNATHPALDRREPDRGQAPAPKQAPPALPSAAASSAGAGSSAPFAAALLALLCLLAPRALELARSPHRKLFSQLSSSRLERPG